ncbi:MAG: DUF362 domain-containing protein [Oscillospiraceae bacterium]
MPAAPVHIAKASYCDEQDLQKKVEELLLCLPQVQALKSNSNVVLKPNLMSPRKPEEAVTTHPAVVRAVVLALQKKGVQSITIAESPGGPSTPRSIASLFTACGVRQALQSTGAVLYEDIESTALAAPNAKLVRRFSVLNPIAKADLIINLPKLKTHVLTGLSGAVKNLFGVVPGLQKAEFHMQFPQREHFGQMLIDLQQALPPTVHLVDAMLAMEGDGPGGGVPKDCGVLLAGQDPYAIDLALCSFIGMPAATVPYLQAGAAQGLCAEMFDPAQLQGEVDAAEAFLGFVLPSSYQGDLLHFQRMPKLFSWVIPAIAKFTAPRPRVLHSKCIGCARCKDICPQKVISIKNGKAHIKRKGCIKCFCCHEVCPVKAIEVYRSRLVHGRQ